MGICQSSHLNISNISISIIEYSTPHGPVNKTYYILNTRYKGLNWFRGCMFEVYNRSLEYSSINIKYHNEPLYKVMITINYNENEYVINNIIEFTYEQVNNHIKKIHTQLKLPCID